MRAAALIVAVIARRRLAIAPQAALTVGLALLSARLARRSPDVGERLRLAAGKEAFPPLGSGHGVQRPPAIA